MAAPITPPISTPLTTLPIDLLLPRARSKESLTIGGSGETRLAGGAAGARLLGLVRAGHEGGVHLLEHHVAVDDALAHVGAAGQVVHDVEQHLFEDGAQTASTGAAQERLLGHG